MTRNCRAMYSLRPAVESDRAWLLDLRREVYRDLTLATFGDLDESRNRRHADKCWEQGNISIIQSGGEDIGMVQVIETAGSVSLEEIQILGAHQRKGFGSKVLMDIMDRARTELLCVKLATGIKNEDARRFYLGLGFRIVGESETHTLMEFAPGDEGSATAALPA